MIDVKICGLSKSSSVIAAAQGGARYTGYIFFEKSPRHVSEEQARDLALLSKELGAEPVAVTVNADDDKLDRIVRIVCPHVLQLHGAETPERVAEVKQRYGLDVWKAIAISEPKDLEKLAAYEEIIDRYLLDAKPPKGSALPGGNAVSFDWSILDQMPAGPDYLLSGGIHIGNLAQALATKPPGLDLSSGVESAPGIKDNDKVKAFLQTVRELS